MIILLDLVAWEGEYENIKSGVVRKVVISFNYWLKADEEMIQSHPGCQ